MVRVAYLTTYLAHEVFHNGRAVDGREFSRRLANVLEVVPDHGRDGDGVPDPDANRAECVIVVNRTDLEFALLEEEDLRVLVSVEDGGTFSWLDCNLQDEQFAGGAFARSLIVVTSVTTSQCSPSPALVTLMVSMEPLLSFVVRTIWPRTIAPAAFLVYDENVSYFSEKWCICVMCQRTNRVSLGPLDVFFMGRTRRSTP